MACLKVAKKGYFGGSPENVRNALVTDVIDVLDFEDFSYEFEDSFHNLNKGGPK